MILRVTKVSPRMRRFVIEQDAVAGIHAVGLAVVDGDPVGIELGDSVGRARDRTASFPSAASPAPGRTVSEVEAW